MLEVGSLLLLISEILHHFRLFFETFSENEGFSISTAAGFRPCTVS